MSRHPHRPSRRRTLPARSLTFAAAALVIAACGGDDRDTAPVTAPAVTAPADTALAGDRVATPPTAVLAGLEVLGGGSFDAEALAGEPTLLWFWAPWCTTCRAEAPHLLEAVAAHGDDLRVVGVPGRDAVGAMERFVDDTGTGDLTHVVDPDGTVWSEFGVFGQPAFAFVTADGELDVFVGTLGRRGLDERIERLLTA